MRKLISLATAVALVLTMSVPSFAAPAPVPGNPAWDAKYVSAKTLDPSSGPAADIPNNPRSNASGDKITSNAHSADFPGLYFYWNDKQKDNGVLLVNPEVFDLFVDGKFVLTAKNSNNYWGYEIKPDQGQLIGGVYAYGIPKQIQYLDSKGKKQTEDLKNINMVFIDGNYKPAKFIIEKVWYDEEGVEVTDTDAIASLNSLLKFGNNYKLGENIVAISDYTTAYNGKKITVTENAIPGYALKEGTSNSYTITVKWNDDPTKVVTFHNQKKWAKIVLDKVWLDLDGEVIDTPEGLEALFNTEFGTGLEVGTYLVKEGTYEIYGEDPIEKYALVRVSGVDVDEDGIMTVTVAAGDKAKVVFTNQDTYTPEQFSVDIEKWVDGQFILNWLEEELDIYDFMDMMSFKLYKVEAKGDAFDPDYPVADGELFPDGVISFGNYEAEEGWYVIVETLTAEGLEIFYEPEPLYIYVNVLGVYTSEPVAHISGPDFGTVVSHSGAGVTYVLPDVWDGVLQGQPAYEMLKTMGAQWVWDVENPYVYGVTGSVYTENFTFDADASGVTKAYLAADNAAVVYVNGKLAGFTEVAFNTPGNDPAEDLADFDFGLLTADVFSGGWADGWNYSYAFDLPFVEGENVVNIIAANSAQTVNTGTANDGYNETNNPCGLLFGFIIPPGAVFENKTIVPPQFGIDIKKWVDQQFVLDWAEEFGYDIIDLMDMMSFELYKLVDEETDEWESVAIGILMSDGIISFGNIEEFDPGDYKLVETLIDRGVGMFEEPEDYLFTVVDEDFEGAFHNYTFPDDPPARPIADKIPSKQHADKWWDQFGILAYGASSNQDKYDYFIAFAEGFWDLNESVTIGFGNKNNMFEAIIEVDAAGNLICSLITFRDQQKGGKVYFDSHYTLPKMKQKPFDISVGAYFDNPYGAGSMQLWLLEIQPKAEEPLAGPGGRSGASAPLDVEQEPVIAPEDEGEAEGEVAPPAEQFTEGGGDEGGDEE